MCVGVWCVVCGVWCPRNKMDDVLIPSQDLAKGSIKYGLSNCGICHACCCIAARGPDTGRAGPGRYSAAGELAAPQAEGCECPY